MTEAEFQLARAAGFLFAAAFALSLQTVFRHTTLRESWRVNLPIWGLNAVVLGIVCGACACTVARWAEASGTGLLNLSRAPMWASVPVTVLVLDMVSYAWHRANHRIAFLWRFHRVHHSDPSFTATTAVRFHTGELLLSLPLRLAAVVLLGPPVVAVFVFELVFNLSNLVEHGNIDLPASLEDRLGRALVTPALHRRHHSRRLRELDTNFGTIFTLWDRAFGTFGHSSSSTRFDTGLPDGSSIERVTDALRLPFRGVDAPTRPRRA